MNNDKSRAKALLREIQDRVEAMGPKLERVKASLDSIDKSLSRQHKALDSRKAPK